jgi:hypothetical protein
VRGTPHFSSSSQTHCFLCGDAQLIGAQARVFGSLISPQQLWRAVGVEDYTTNRGSSDCIRVGTRIAATILLAGPSNMQHPQGSEVSSMAEKFSAPELAALRSELLLGFDSKDAAELVQLFLAGHGYGVSAEAARHAVSRVGMMGSTLEVFQRELERIALAM